MHGGTVFKIFRWSFAVTIVVLLVAFVWRGPEIFLIIAILGILEISLSFDNAVVNATILDRMNPWWQRFFLSVGIIIAVFGMRLLFPLAIVAVTAGMGPIEVVDVAINNPDLYAEEMDQAHPAIAAFGGMFLAMIFLDFMLGEREQVWIRWIERPFARLGGVESISVVVALIALMAAARGLGGDEMQTILIAGLMGLVLYLLVNGLAGYFESATGIKDDDLVGIAGPVGPALGGGRRTNEVTKLAGKAAFFLFLYLELLDASFSFDGVIGAFAISNQIFVIAAGLGIGAMYVRSMTVYLVRKGTLSEYVFLEHGAHYAIGALAALLFFSIRFEIPEIITGLIGVGFILLALGSSIRLNRREGLESKELDSSPL
jgi:hypothetical protein